MRYKEFAESDDDMFAPRQAQRIAQYLHSTAHQGDDPELTQTIQGLARAFDQGMQPGLAALKAVDSTSLKLTLLDEFNDELGIDLEDDYVRIGILESADIFGQRAKPVLAPTPIGKICADLAQQAHGWAEEARAEGNMEDADWCMEQYQEYIEVAQAFQRSWEQGLARWNQTQDPPRNQLRRAVQDQLNTDLAGAWRDARSKVKESDDLFAPPRPRTQLYSTNLNTVEIEGIDWQDPNDISNVYVSAAQSVSGRPLSQAQLDRLTDELYSNGMLLDMVMDRMADMDDDGQDR